MKERDRDKEREKQDELQRIKLLDGFFGWVWFIALGESGTNNWKTQQQRNKNRKPPLIWISGFGDSSGKDI